MNGWGIAVIALMTAQVAVAVVKHGEDRPRYNAGFAIVGALADAFLFYMAGMWH